MGSENGTACAEEFTHVDCKLHMQYIPTYWMINSTQELLLSYGSYDDRTFTISSSNTPFTNTTNTTDA